jgi:hypothetical protein
MPARLIALHPARGASQAVAGECWIESDVTRIGSAPDNELQIGGVEPQLATVRYRDGHYEVYRRSDRPLVLGGRPLPLNTPVAWPPGLILGIADSVSLVLTVEANPAPTPRPLIILADELAGREQTRRAGWNRRVRQLLVALPLMSLAFVLGRGQAAPLRPSTEFSAIQKKLDVPDPQRPRLALWRERLQEARLQELQKRAGVAYQTHEKLRDKLLEVRYLANPPLSKTEQEVLAYVHQELDRLRKLRTPGW